MLKNKFHLACILVTVVFGLAAFLAGCGAGGGEKAPAAGEDKKGADKTYVIKLAHESPATHSKGVWAEDFKKAVEEKSGGRIKVELFHQGQLYASEEAGFQAVINGLIQMAIPSTGYVSAVVPQFQVVDLPMMFPDQEALYKFEDSEVGKELLAKLEPKGVKGLGYISNIPLDLFSKEPIVKISDFKGKKIRTHTAVLESSVKALGGNPMAMPASELYLAIEQGIVDGAFTTVTYAAPNKYYEITKHMTKARISAIAYPVIINLQFWNSLPDDLKKVMEEAVAEAIRQNRAKLKDQEEKALKTLQNGGMQVHELSPEEHAQWVKALQAVYDEYGKVIGQDLIDKVKNLK
ncbi:MAG: TRAP transporter substrate-binding protein [Bacillota bacterium]